MATFWLGLLIGAGISLVFTPILILVISFVKKLKLRIKAGEELKAGRILQPIDERDYNPELWEKDIDVEGNRDILKKYKSKVFEKKGNGIKEVNEGGTVKRKR